MKFQKPPGTQDVLPGQSETWQFVERTARDLCRRFHYREIRTPMFETTDLFKRGVGETTDIVEKEMYTFEDRGGRSMTLRPEGTAGVVRAYVENKLYGEPDIAKLYYIGPMYRYERAQAGRYRQFHQFGVEAIGSSDPALDAEVIALGYSFYKDVGLSGVTVEINSVGTPEVRAAFRSRLLDFLTPMKDSLCKDCQSRMERNPLRVLDCKIDQAKFEGAPSILDSLDEECEAHFVRVRESLDAMNIPYAINPRLVRGLDYYTHTAFEYKAQGIGSIDTVGGGGRYNGLVADVGGEDRPGVGLGIGLERTMLLLESQNVQPVSGSPVDVFFIAMGERAEREATGIVHRLREAGIAVERDYQGRKPKALFKAADRAGAKVTLILGDDELDRGEIAVKDMAAQEQKQVPLGELAAAIQAIVSN
ncbi:histidine--tRNA ligase [Cohnella lubricantis]|uniref:Histidine--tRNA ligase n=1 Tax=Cohnella lubricantis TaxID=2163172 RepID=A0A841TIW0_9BACL|nr:histidine--tRNA ligase [Cohnella lubricantis]MBB6678867.1 histidine--tRNA ligase [Cohnella lubricantis]MBP2118230.1 histidyl-tRNA synthetase [Cohnella lubricantis]